MVEVVPSIFIKNINLNNLLNDFLKGDYNFNTVSTKQKYKNIELVDNTYGTSFEDKKAYISINNQKMQVATDNVDIYSHFIKNDKPIIKGGVCHWCRCNFDDYSLGVPIRIIKNGYYLVEGNYCCFECVYAGILLEKHVKPLWKDSELLLKIIFKKFYPNEKLEPSREWRLLVSNGGSLTKEQFFDYDKHLFKTSCNFIYPIKNIYV